MGQDISEHRTPLDATIFEKQSNNLYKRDIQTTESESSNDPIDEKFPEGGLQAWLVVLGAWCAMIPSMGLLNTIGVLHAWTAEHQLAAYSPSSVGWIFGVYSFFLYFGSAQVGM
jgi:hypothetical protein